MRVIRSAGQNVSPSDDGRLFDQAFTDGLFEDATIVANGGNTISLSALYGIICGRDFTAEAQTISAVLPQTDTATGYVYVEFDTSSDDIITIGTALAPFTPTYENINTNGAVVQMVIAEYTASAVAVTAVTPTYVKASAGGVGSLAMIEASPATANHAVGTYLVYNGILYSVTSAIAIGESLAVGTNIAEAKVGDALSELKNGLSNKDWKYLVRNVNANGTYTMDYDFSEIDSLMFLFIYGSLPRQSVVLPKAHVEYYENQCMPDVMFANSRCYLKATFSGKQMTVTDFTNGIANAWWYVFCKLK